MADKGTSTSYSLSRRIGAAKSKEITTIEDFAEYRNREETSLLKPNTLVAGSHDVLIGVTGMLTSRPGYYLDGPKSSTVSVTRPLNNWESGKGVIYQFRAGGLTNPGVSSDGQLQFRYIDTYGALGPANATTWQNLLSGLTSVYFQSTNFWDTSALQGKNLFVNRTNKIWEWNGALTTVNSNTLTTITSDGTKSFAQLGFTFDSAPVLGDATTVYNVTSAADAPGSLITLTYASGTDPSITSATMPVGTIITLQSAGNLAGQYAVTSVGTDTFTFYWTSLLSVPSTYTGKVFYDYNYNGGSGYTISANGNTYFYLGGALSNPSIPSGPSTFAAPTLTGLSAVPALTQHIPIWQQVLFSTFQNLTFGNITPTPSSIFTCDLIATIQGTNQVTVSSISNNIVYLSRAGNYKDYSQSTARIQYDGDMLTTLGTVAAFQPQESAMYISAGINEWYVSQFTPTTITNSTSGVTTTYETAQLVQLKTTANQAAVSQYATTKIENDVSFVSNEYFVRSLGRVTDVYGTPQISDLSYPIYTDVVNYPLTDVSVFYFQQRLWVSYPTIGIVRIYNMTNPKKPFWEAPQYLPVSGFSSVGNMLIGHSYNTFESYIMYQGGSDRATSINTTGNPISAVAVLAFQVEGLRAKRKSFNKFFIEGYMQPSTTFMIGLVYRSPQPGLIAGQTFTFLGTDPRVLNSPGDVSLGKLSLGKNPLAGNIQLPNQLNYPPYFAAIFTSPRVPFLAYQPMFSSYGVNQTWNLLSFGTNMSPTSELENDLQT